MNQEEILNRLKKHGIQQVSLTSLGEKIRLYEEIGYMFVGVRDQKQVEGTILYSIEHKKYCVTEKSKQSGYWL